MCPLNVVARVILYNTAAWEIGSPIKVGNFHKILLESSHHSTPFSPVGVLLNIEAWTWCNHSDTVVGRTDSLLNRSNHATTYVERSFMMMATMPCYYHLHLQYYSHLKYQFGALSLVGSFQYLEHNTRSTQQLFKSVSDQKPNSQLGLPNSKMSPAEELGHPP